MKKLLFILFLTPVITKGQSFFHRNGNQGFDVLGNRHYWNAYGDTVAYAHALRFKFFKSIGNPVWTTATRPSDPAAGDQGYNSDSSRIEWYTGSAWAQAGTGSGGGGITGFTDGNGFDGTVSGSDLSITTSLTTGSIPFIGASGALSQDNSNLFWNNTDKRIGVGTIAPTHPLTFQATPGVLGIAMYKTTDQTTNYSRGIIRMNNSGSNGQLLVDIQSGGTGVASGVAMQINGVEKFSFDAATTILSTNLFFSGDNAQDIGRNAASAFRPRNVYIANAAQVGLPANTTITAKLHLGAGTTSASSAPIKLTSGSLMTSAEVGAIEFLTDKPYFTITTGTARKEFALNDIALTSGRIPFITTNGRLTDNASALYDGGAMSLGISGAKLTLFSLFSSGDNTISSDDQNVIVGGIVVSRGAASDADFTLTTAMQSIVLPQISANRALTLPSPVNGQIFIIHNENSAGFAWNITGTLQDKANAAVTALANDTVYIIQGISNTHWKIVTIY